MLAIVETELFDEQSIRNADVVCSLTFLHCVHFQLYCHCAFKSVDFQVLFLCMYMFLVRLGSQNYAF